MPTLWKSEAKYVTVPASRYLTVELVTEHEGQPPGVVDLVVRVGDVEVIRWPYAEDGVISYCAKVKVELEPLQ